MELKSILNNSPPVPAGTLVSDRGQPDILCGRLLKADLDHVRVHTADLWRELNGKRLFITGGTGFFGIWLLESLIDARERLGLNLRATVLSRFPEDFLARYPRFQAVNAIDWLRGDVCDFEFPREPYACIIHLATETHASKVRTSALDTFDTIVRGTRRVLDFAVQTAAEQVLLTSSGAVYGLPPTGITHVAEDFSGAPDSTNPESVYGEGKRAAELLAALYRDSFGLSVKIARCFAFVGPYLPLDKHFAIGNFLNDALHGRDIEILGDGTPHRSYMHTADLIVWLLTILLRGAPMRPYNVGSDQSLSIAELARLVAELSPSGKPAVHIAKLPESGKPPKYYVPEISRARSELGLEIRIPLEQAISRTFEWHHSLRNES